LSVQSAAPEYNTEDAKKFFMHEAETVILTIPDEEPGEPVIPLLPQLVGQ